LKSKFRQYLFHRFNLPGQVNGLPYALWRRLPKGAPIVLVDVGAHDGMFTDAVREFCGIKRALLVEPIPWKAADLRRKFESPIFEVCECVLSDRVGNVSLEVNAAQDTSSVLRIKRELPQLANVGLGQPRYVSCSAQTLDGVLERAGIERVNLLKLDVQGFEDRVLGGGRKSLLATDLVWAEVSFVPLYEESCTFSQIHSILTATGFMMLDLHPVFRGPDGELLQADALFRRRRA
jgi:FkbM family methyltransferase